MKCFKIHNAIPVENVYFVFAGQSSDGASQFHWIQLRAFDEFFP